MQSICLGAARSCVADAISVHPSFPVALPLAFQQQLAVVLKFPPQLVLSPSFKLDPIILGQLLFSLDLCIDLLWACILPCPAFVASLSPCTRICRLARWEESSFFDCQDPEDYVLLEVLSSEPAETSPLTTHHSNLYFPTFMCSKGQEATCDHLIQQ